MSATAPAAPGPAPAWRAWAPDAALGLAVAFLGLLEATNTEYVESPRTALALVALGFAVAVGLSRRAPGVALALLWAVGTLQVLGSVDLMLVQVSVAVVAFGTARWGSVATVWASALSIPTAALIGVLVVGQYGLGLLVQSAGFEAVVQEMYRYGDTWQVGAAVVGMSLLGVPWLAGLALRFMARAKVSEVSQEVAEVTAARAVIDREQAQEIARLREDQARLARDVHDVVGHSLAVILAQAESAQFLPDDDPAALKQTMANIATSARTSLQDVRQVLASTQDGAPRTAGLQDLVDNVRASGHQVASSVVGKPRPLPPELETVAYRVLQEMLTNAIKHGRRDAPVTVEQHWEGELRLEVRNAVARVDTPAPPVTDETRPVAVLGEQPGARSSAGPDSSGQGLEGMRRRLESVGGRLDVRRREEPGGPTFTATAWLPVRTVSP